MKREFMHTHDVMAELGLTQPTVLKLFKDGSIPAAKIGGKWFVRRADLDALFPTTESVVGDEQN